MTNIIQRLAEASPADQWRTQVFEGQTKLGFDAWVLSQADVGTANVNTIKSIAVHDGDVDQQDSIWIRPRTESDGTVVWDLYIPPTHESHFEYANSEGFSNPEDFDPLVNDIKGPFSESNWESLSGAVACLSLAVRQGQIKFNDGRTVI